MTFNIDVWSIKKVIFSSLGVTIATSLLRSTGDFLKLSFQMFPCNEIMKDFKSEI